MPMMNKHKMSSETPFEYKLRLIRGHADGTLDADWNEINELLGGHQNPDHLRKVAKGIMEYDAYLHNEGGTSHRILALSDFHVPFQVPIGTFSKYAGRIDTLVLNGDIVDMQAISRFPKTYRVSPIEELIEARQYIIGLVRMLKPAQVILIDGNHEKRFEAYLAKNLDSSVAELMPSSAMELVAIDGFHHYQRATGTKLYYEPLRDLLIEDGIDVVYAGNWHYKIGSVIFAHPLAYSTAMLKTAEKAAQYFFRVDRDFKTIVMAHTHKLGMFVQGGVTLIEQGCCCCTEKMNYSDGKLFLPQQKGYCYLELDANANLKADSLKMEQIDLESEVTTREANVVENCC